MNRNLEKKATKLQLKNSEKQINVRIIMLKEIQIIE